MTQQACNNSLELFRRNRYFYGKLMTVRDFETEQGYMNEKRYLLNRLVTGAGVVCGFNDMQVYTEGLYVKVRFPGGGVAIDCCGREIVIPAGSEREVYRYEGQIKIRLSVAEVAVYPHLYLVTAPREYEYVNSPANPSSCEETCCANRILEDFEVIASGEVPANHTVVFPTMTDEDTNDTAAVKIKGWLKNESIGACSACDDIGVFFLTLQSGSGGGVAIDTQETGLYLSFVADNRLLSEILKTHLTDFSNPHRVTVEQIGALSRNGGAITGPLSITSYGQSLLSVTSAGAQVSLVTCQRIISYTSDHRPVYGPVPGGLSIKSQCSYAMQGILVGNNTLQQLQLLTQASTSVLAQANQQPQNVLQLFRGSSSSLSGSESSSELSSNSRGMITTNTIGQLATGRLINIAGDAAAGLSTGRMAIQTNISSLLTAHATAAVKGVSYVNGGYGVYAFAPAGTPALYVAGTSVFSLPAQFLQGLNGYVTSIFRKAADTTLTVGQVVQLDITNTTSLIPMVKPATSSGVIMGIVAGLGTGTQSVISLLRDADMANEVQDFRDESGEQRALAIINNISSLNSSDMVYVVSHGVFSSVRVETITEPLLSISAGDWLVASDYISGLSGGYAKRSSSVPEAGKAVGIALKGLDVNATGIIPVLINLR